MFDCMIRKDQGDTVIIERQPIVTQIELYIGLRVYVDVAKARKVSLSGPNVQLDRVHGNFTIARWRYSVKKQLASAESVRYYHHSRAEWRGGNRESSIRRGLSVTRYE